MLTRLREALQDAAAGSGSLSVLSGEAGIGKTRVVEVLAREVTASGLPVAWGFCREVGDAPALWPLTQLVRDLVVKLRVDPAQLRPELRSVVPELFGLPAVGGGRELHRSRATPPSIASSMPSGASELGSGAFAVLVDLGRPASRRRGDPGVFALFRG